MHSEAFIAKGFFVISAYRKSKVSEAFSYVQSLIYKFYRKAVGYAA
uniref:Uncharacterized protein n=1 Tax=Candidatus Kentrum sp. FM TaxID=2126340 RepID=A0A450RUP3_9GAMM|nr:MAG: hypothetical protein BECKFM1743A_GA0114220_100023 [Candidatus Kentron sp. FM]VFJ43515.1 MAG: hypothetical protein BECKFM1743C_GA0114222_100023 [Candidatus Kentron sp. FM]VFK05554.1 MAG: hypothetical protein BECKFM1743B_GA0114221_100023 [Candidatus Kentron sp. FM]